jgi:hypothetical protein
MGRQQGLLYLTGQYGDLRLSISADGKPIAAFAPVKRGRVKKDANYALTRKNNDEFTGSAYSAHSLRMCFGERVKQFADRQLTARLMRLTRSVISKGPGRGGERSFEVGPHLGAFRHLELSKNESLTSRFMAPFTVTVNPDRNTATLVVPAFDTDFYVNRPSGATHFSVLLVVGVLSDFDYTGDADVYAPVNPTMNALSTVVQSAVLPAFNAVNGPMQLVAAIAGAPILPSSACLVVSVGVEFYRVINTFEELMASGNAMRVVEVV